MSVQEKQNAEKYNYSYNRGKLESAISLFIIGQEENKLASKSPVKSNFYISQYDKIVESKVNSQDDKNELVTRMK